MRTRYRYIDGELVETDKAAPEARLHLIGDYLPNVKNPLDGKMYDSRSAYLKTVRANGCEVIGDTKSLPNGSGKRFLRD